MPIIQIKDRWDDTILYETDAKDLCDAIEKATAARVNLTRANLTDANLTDAKLTGANLTDANLTGANLTGANLTGANLTGANLTGANLTRANLTDAKLTGANLTDANLAYANLAYANLARANLTDAKLTGANLTDANLTRANLTRANLAYANLTRANLAYANLAYTNLTRANLAYVNLAYANLTRANLTDAQGFDPRRVNPLLFLFDQPGLIRSYKLVTAFGEGPFNGGIKYEVGQIYEVNDFNTDPFQDCGAGINLGTLPWCMQNAGEGYRILIAEHTAEDIVAIPWFSDGKYRVKKCRIVGEKEI